MGIATNLRRAFGVRIRLHYTWSVAFILTTAVVVTHFPEAYPLWQRITLGIAASLLFLISIIIREFTISATATVKGIRMKSVTLFVFGGISPIAKEPTLPVLELLLALAGLSSNLIIAGMFYTVYIALVTAGSVIIAGLIQWLAFISLMLAFFHFIPSFPLDGGRAVRALIWMVTGNYSRAARITSWTGRGIGLLLAVGGILALVMARQWFVGLLLAFTGWSLHTAAAWSRRQETLLEALQSITARDVMTREFPFISQQLNLGQLIRDYILVTGQRYFVIVDDAKFQGIVTIHNIKPIPKQRWDSTHIGEIMIPASELKAAHPGQSAASLLEQMDELGINRMPVLEEEKVIGVVARDSLIRLVKTRAELKM